MKYQKVKQSTEIETLNHIVLILLIFQGAVPVVREAQCPAAGRNGGARTAGIERRNIL